MVEETGSLPGGESGGGAGARVLREIIRTPVFMEIIKTNIAEVDPESAREMVRALLWQDVNLSLSLLGASPAMVNYLVEALLELGRQLNTFPEPLLQEFMLQMSDDLTTGRLGDFPEVYGPLLEKALFSNPEIRARVAGGLCGGVNACVRGINRILNGILESEPLPGRGSVSLDAGALGEAVTLTARLINRSLSGNPHFLRDVAGNIDAREVMLAAFSLTRALLASILSLVGRFVGSLYERFFK